MTVGKRLPPVFSRYSRFGTPYVAILFATLVGIAIALEIPFGPVIPTVAIVVSVWLLIQADLHKILIGLGGLVIAVPFYFLMKKQYLEGK